MKDRLYENDGWILLAVLISSDDGDPVSLADVIAAADYLNHAIPTLGELDGAFSRLCDRDWLLSDGEGFVPSKSATAMYASRRGDGKSLLSHLDFVNEQIGAKGWLPGLAANDPAECSFAGLSRKKYKAACRDYLNRT